MKIVIPKFSWMQIGGDMDPGTYGGTIAQADGDRIELLKIQPVREYVGDREALDVGFPFWSREAMYDLDDLMNADDGALRYVGLDIDELRKMDPKTRAVAVAEALLEHGDGVDEGPSGWAKDVLGSRMVKWNSGKRQGWRYLADEDQEFRSLQREAKRGKRLYR